MIESGFTRVIAPTLLALILLSNIACSAALNPTPPTGTRRKQTPTNGNLAKAFPAGSAAIWLAIPASPALQISA